MPNKTIYISDNDASLFEEAKQIAGESLSSVISRALSEYVAQNKKKTDGMKEITVEVGSPKSYRQQSFIGTELGKWSGISDDKEWFLEAKIYKTQKNSFAVLLTTVAKASLMLNPTMWRESGDYLTDVRKSELIVGKTVDEFKTKVPQNLFSLLESMAKKNESPVEFLDI